jgi:hypothetical protein
VYINQFWFRFVDAISGDHSAEIDQDPQAEIDQDPQFDLSFEGPTAYTECIVATAAVKISKSDKA